MAYCLAPIAVKILFVKKDCNGKRENGLAIEPNV